MRSNEFHIYRKFVKIEEMQYFWMVESAWINGMDLLMKGYKEQPYKNQQRLLLQGYVFLVSRMAPDHKDWTCNFLLR